MEDQEAEIIIPRRRKKKDPFENDPANKIKFMMGNLTKKFGK